MIGAYLFKMKELREKLENRIAELEKQKYILDSSADKDYVSLSILVSKITAFYEALNLTYAD